MRRVPIFRTPDPADRILISMTLVFHAMYISQDDETEEGGETKAKLQTVNARLLAQIEEQVRIVKGLKPSAVAEKCLGRKG